MTRYAERTSVSPDRSEAEIRALAKRYNVVGFVTGWRDTTHRVEFELSGRRLRFTLTIPPQDTRTTKVAYDQDVRRRWRLLVLKIKATFEAVLEDGESVEEAALGHIVLPNNQTIAEWSTPQIDEAYRTKRMPPLLPGAETMPVITLPAAKEPS